MPGVHYNNWSAGAETCACPWHSLSVGRRGVCPCFVDVRSTPVSVNDRSDNKRVAPIIHYLSGRSETGILPAAWDRTVGIGLLPCQNTTSLLILHCRQCLLDFQTGLTWGLDRPYLHCRWALLAVQISTFSNLIDKQEVTMLETTMWITDFKMLFKKVTMRPQQKSSRRRLWKM